jgi:hypothetical protein
MASILEGWFSVTPEKIAIYKVTRLYKDCSTVIFSTDKTHKRDTYAEILATHLGESWTHHSH